MVYTKIFQRLKGWDVPQYVPANTRHWANVGWMLGRRRRRRANIEPPMVKCLVLAVLESGSRWSLRQPSGHHIIHSPQDVTPKIIQSISIILYHYRWYIPPHLPTTHTTFQQTNLETLSKCWVNVGLCSWVNANLAIYGPIAAESARACIFMFCQAVPWIYAWPRKASWSVYGFRLDLSFTGGGGAGRGAAFTRVADELHP